MTEAPKLYHVTLTANAEGAEVAEAMRIAFAEGGPFLATPLSFGTDDGYLTVRFAGVSDDPNQTLTTVEYATAGAEIVNALAGFSHQHSLTVAVIKALLTFTAMREIAGLPPRDELRIDVVPAPPLPQDSVSPQLSDSLPDRFPQFGHPQDPG